MRSGSQKTSSTFNGPLMANPLAPSKRSCSSAKSSPVGSNLLGQPCHIIHMGNGVTDHRATLRQGTLEGVVERSQRLPGHREVLEKLDHRLLRARPLGPQLLEMARRARFNESSEHLERRKKAASDRRAELSETKKRAVNAGALTGKFRTQVKAHARKTWHYGLWCRRKELCSDGGCVFSSPHHSPRARCPN